MSVTAIKTVKPEVFPAFLVPSMLNNYFYKKIGIEIITEPATNTTYH